MLCKRGKCLLKSWMSAFMLFYKPEEEASSASQDDPQAVSSPCLPFSRPDWKHQPAGLTVWGKRQTVGPAALYSFKYLKYVPGSCQAGRCQAYARVFHDCADRFVYIITFCLKLLVYASWHSNSELSLVPLFLGTPDLWAAAQIQSLTSTGIGGSFAQRKRVW